MLALKKKEKKGALFGLELHIVCFVFRLMFFHRKLTRKKLTRSGALCARADGKKASKMCLQWSKRTAVGTVCVEVVERPAVLLQLFLAQL